MNKFESSIVTLRIVLCTEYHDTAKTSITSIAQNNNKNHCNATCSQLEAIKITLYRCAQL